MAKGVEGNFVRIFVWIRRNIIDTRDCQEMEILRAFNLEMPGYKWFWRGMSGPIV